jgi:uncharacterized protein
MKLDLREIIEMPGKSVPFSCELETDLLTFPAVQAFKRPPYAEGVVRNTAGALTLEGTLTAEMVCSCDRCGKTFEKTKVLPLSVPLAAQLEDEENPDIFLLEGDSVNLSEVLETCLILDMETKFLCDPQCKGLCARCGANLNDGPCSCGKEIDPRMAVLEQLLDS